MLMNLLYGLPVMALCLLVQLFLLLAVIHNYSRYACLQTT